VRTEVPDDLPLVAADFAQLAQVLTNLLANAARHAPAGSEVAIVATSAGGSSVRVAVVDHGPGFPAEGRDVLFEPFRRGEGSRSTGLGLAICRGVVAAHGGAIGLDDTPGGGATVWFTLPVHRPRPEDGR
jgi:two-component system sensor histidine kinase KdpD